MYLAYLSSAQANNAIVKEFGDLRTEDKLYNHVDLVGLLGIVDLEAGTTVAGGRGYYLINEVGKGGGGEGEASHKIPAVR